MRQRWLVVLACLALVGAGCIKSGNPPDWPTDQQLAAMTPAEKQSKMAEFMQTHPAQQLTKDEVQAEINQAHDLILHHDIEQEADFQPSNEEAQGSARIVRNGAQEYLVLSDDFFVDPGPYLAVYLNDGLDPLTLGSGALELGRLKLNDGGQAYTIPPGTDVSKFRSVVIYDQPFHVVFGYAAFK